MTKIVKKTRRNAALFQKKCTESCCCFIDFGAIFPPGGTPGASRAPLGAQVGSQVDFFMVFRRPRGGFGTPFGPFGLPWGALGSHLGAESGAKRVKKSIPGARCVPEASLGVKSEGPGPA